jgi:hypothetical protein
MKAGDDFLEALQERPAIQIVGKDIGAGVAPRGDMIDRAFKFYSQWTRHDPSRIIRDTLIARNKT